MKGLLRKTSPELPTRRLHCGLLCVTSEGYPSGRGLNRRYLCVETVYLGIRHSKLLLPSGIFILRTVYVLHVMPRQGKASITVDETTRDELRDEKPAGVTWDRYLLQLQTRADFE